MKIVTMQKLLSLCFAATLLFISMVSIVRAEEPRRTADEILGEADLALLASGHSNIEIDPDYTGPMPTRTQALQAIAELNLLAAELERGSSPEVLSPRPLSISSTVDYRYCHSLRHRYMTLRHRAKVRISSQRPHPITEVVDHSVRAVERGYPLVIRAEFDLERLRESGPDRQNRWTLGVEGTVHVYYIGFIRSARVMESCRIQ